MGERASLKEKIQNLVLLVIFVKAFGSFCVHFLIQKSSLLSLHLEWLFNKWKFHFLMMMNVEMFSCRGWIFVLNGIAMFINYFF